MKKIIYIFSIVSIFTACDKIDTPLSKVYEESLKDVVIDNDVAFTFDELKAFKWDTVSSPDNSNKQFIVLQEFTGHTCPNCPLGTKEMIRLDSVMGDQLIPVSIHAGSYATPNPNNPDGSFSSDHRVKEIIEQDYLQKVGISAFPTGLINNNGLQLIYKKWEAEINQIKDNTPVASLKITNLYNDSLKIIRSIISYEWFDDLNEAEKYGLQVFLTEDHVIDWQINIDYNEPNYDHRYMLRKVINPLFGVEAVEAKTGNIGKKEYIFSAISKPPQANWKVEDLHVVGFLYNMDSPFSIVQANSAPIPVP